MTNINASTASAISSRAEQPLSSRAERARESARAADGTFGVQVHSEPEAHLVRFDPAGAGCDACGVHDRMPGENYCEQCFSEMRGEGQILCARCESPATGEDGLCDRHTKRWGELSVREGSRTPWGIADNVEPIAPGIVFAGTPSHGGVKLSPERNKLIPAALRSGSGWYEEDCQSYVVLRYFPDEWASQPHMSHYSPEEIREQGEDGLKRWFPEQWEKANGRELRPGESRAKDEREWARRHADVPVVISASRAESDPDKVVVWARNGGDEGDRSTEAEYLVPRAEYATRMEDNEPGQNHRFVVDPKRHPKLPPRPKAPQDVSEPVYVDAGRLSASALSQAYIDGSITATARDRIAKDLSQRWRRADGRVEDMRTILSEGGVSGKTAYADGTSMSYAILQPDAEHGGNFSLKVSKATWDFLDEVKDDRSPATVAQQTAHTYQERLDRKWGGPTRKEQERAQHLYAVARQLREQADAERVAREGTPEQREAARKAAEAAREKAATIDASGGY